MSTYLIHRPVRAAWPLAPQGRPVGSGERAGFPQDAASLTRDGEDGVLTVEAPGLDPATDLSVQVSGDRLTVSGTRRDVVGSARRERRFARSVVLPEGVGADAVSASYQAGVLRVRVAGMFPAPARPETVDITISSDVTPAAATPAADAAA